MQNSDAAEAATGVLASQHLRALMADERIQAEIPIIEEQVQPSSLDLRLGTVAYRVRASFLPGPDASVQDKLERFAMHRIDLREGAVLEKGCVYIVPLLERVALPDDLSGVANPKSSTGRLDIFTRLITDRAVEFKAVQPGIRDRSMPDFTEDFFGAGADGHAVEPVASAAGVAGDFRYTDAHTSGASPLVDIMRADIKEGVAFSVDLTPADEGLVGYRAKKHTGLIDVDNPGGYAIRDTEPLSDVTSLIRRTNSTSFVRRKA